MVGRVIRPGLLLSSYAAKKVVHQRVNKLMCRAIINFSTSVTKIAAPGYTAYAATKGAVDAMTLILAKEMRGHDVTVNAVAPGPADIAETVAFLAGPARWVNGQVIHANGGVI